MENNTAQRPQMAQRPVGNNGPDLSRLFRHCMRGWYWFALSALVCCSIAALYILRTRPEYTRSATVLIKESESGRRSTSDIESLMNLSGVSSMSSKVVNEVIVFQSPVLMQETVRRLGLTTEYSKPSTFRSNIIYGTQVPVNVEFCDTPSNVSVSFVLNGKDTGSYELSRFYYILKGKKYRLPSVSASFSDTLNTDAGRICISRNSLFTDEWKNPVTVSHIPLDAATKSFVSRLDVSPVDVRNKSDVLSIVLRDHSIQRADDVVNTLINVYNESWLEDKNRMAVSTSEFIEERLVTLEQELGDVDSNISEFKSEKLLPDVDAVSDLYISQTKENAKMLQDLSNQLYVFRYVKTYLANNPGTESLIPASTSINSSAISSQISEYNTTLLNRNNLRSNSSEKNPLVQDLNAVLASTRAAIATAIDNQIETLSAQLDGLRSAERSNNSRIAQSPANAKYLMSVGRQQKVMESLYLYLLQKREENELSRAFTAYNTRVITPPMGNSAPTSPDKLKIMALALLLGLCIPLGIIYILEQSDTKVHTKSDFKSLTLPFLGEVPLHTGTDTAKWRRMLKHESPKSEIVVKHGLRDISNEAFRVIRTNLEFMERGHECPVIVTVSFNPGAGKTYLSLNIAAAFALKEKKVLVIDGDLRRASLSKFINSPSKGLSTYLSGEESDPGKLVVNVEGTNNLDIMPVGAIPPNPTELISMPSLPDLITKLRSQYDYIFIDCPPVGIIADTQIIEEYADRTIFVARAGLFDRKDIASLQQAYDEKSMKNMCYIFNGVEPKSSYYGNYGRYGHYGNNHGYYYSKS